MNAFFTVVLMFAAVLALGTVVNVLLLSKVPAGWAEKNSFAYVTIKSILDSLYVGIGGYAISWSATTIGIVVACMFLFAVSLSVLVLWLNKKVASMKEETSSRIVEADEMDKILTQFKNLK